MLKRALAALAVLVAAGCNHDDNLAEAPAGYSTPPYGYSPPSSGQTYRASDARVTVDDTFVARETQPVRDSEVRVEWGPVRSSREGGGATIQPSTGTSPTRQPSTGTSSSALSAGDREFIAKAASGGLFEVQSSRLALQENPDPETTEFAQMMIKDHTKVNQELQAIASRKGVTVAQTLAPEEQRMVTRLQSLDSDEFADEYRQMQIQAHEEAISLLENAAKTLQDQELRSFAQRTLPTLRAHLNHLKEHAPPG
jgi:putative membrane protein